jgi:putative flippase GtrA
MIKDPRIASGPGHRDTFLRSAAGQGLRLALLSLLSLGLGYLLTSVFHAWVGIATETAFGYAVLVCSVVNFFGCRHFVFRGPKGPLWHEAAKFFPSVLVFRALEIGLFAGLNSVLGNYHVAYFATTGSSMLAKLFLSRTFIFKRPG